MNFTYKTKNTCSSKITFDIDGEVITNIKFSGGCDGNLQAMAKLVDGMTVEEIESKCGKISCGRRGTSCADQLSIAVREAYDAFKRGDASGL